MQLLSFNQRTLQNALNSGVISGLTKRLLCSG